MEFHHQMSKATENDIVFSSVARLATFLGISERATHGHIAQGMPRRRLDDGTFEYSGRECSRWHRENVAPRPDKPKPTIDPDGIPDIDPATLTIADRAGEFAESYRADGLTGALLWLVTHEAWDDLINVHTLTFTAEQYFHAIRDSFDPWGEHALRIEGARVYLGGGLSESTAATLAELLNAGKMSAVQADHVGDDRFCDEWLELPVCGPDDRPRADSWLPVVITKGQPRDRLLATFEAVSKPGLCWCVNWRKEIRDTLEALHRGCERVTFHAIAAEFSKYQNAPTTFTIADTDGRLLWGGWSQGAAQALVDAVANGVVSIEDANAGEYPDGGLVHAKTGDRHPGWWPVVVVAGGQTDVALTIKKLPSVQPVHHNARENREHILASVADPMMLGVTSKAERSVWARTMTATVSPWVKN